MKHLGDITKINGAELEPVDVIIGGSPCFPAGTLVLTNQGYEPIESIKVGDVVYTHKGNWKSVSAVGHKYSNTICLKGNHYGIVSTPNHPFYSAEQKNVWSGNEYIRTLKNVGVWTPASQMQGKRWAVPRFIAEVPVPQIQIQNNWQSKPPVIDSNFMYIVGRWLGDGWLRDNQRIDRPNGQTWAQIFICANHNKIDYLEQRLREVFDGKSSVNRFSRRTVDVLRVNNKATCAWLRQNFGVKADGKTLPAWVYGMDAELRKALLQGYLDSDGYQYKEHKWKVSSVSKKLAHSVRLLAETLGYSCSIHYVNTSPTTIIEGRTVNQKPYYVVDINDTKRSTAIRDERYNWYKCRSMQNYKVNQKVYNITVEDDHSYIVEGFVVHNCQNMSVAGNRKGLSGSQSCLYLEQLRVVKEMRDNDIRNGRTGFYVRPRYMLWENVPGAFSTNKGADFETVIKETIRVIESEAPPVLMPPNGWPTSGCVYSDMGKWSLAWRVLDAQFWGVPQRRKRIALIIDFGGMSAPEILFERKGMRWNTEKSGTARQEIANDLGKSFDVAVFDARGNGDGKTVCTITGDHESRITDYTAICVGNGQVNSALDMTFDVCQTLNCMHDPMAILHKGFVRRLTPLECERLQGFEDGWTDIGEWVDTKGKRHKESSDAARYKAIGNSIALPPWKYILKRISAQYERNATLGSLFDGIGGFPFLWEQINGKGSARWASEIEEFPIAVTRYHFGDS